MQPVLEEIYFQVFSRVRYTKAFDREPVFVDLEVRSVCRVATSVVS